MPNAPTAATILLIASAMFSEVLHAQSASAASAPRAQTPYLSQADAAARSARVSKVAYALEFKLTGEPTFSGSTRVFFDLSDVASPLTLDLDKARISRLRVNGKTLAPSYNQWFLTLPANALVVGRNEVAVDYQRDHSTNGEGLHRYKDAADGRVYLYSHFEPAAAHQMFALFDQPDLKASYQLTVTAPRDWQVISATRETSIANKGVERVWTFPATPILSPYNFSLHAGPYKVWQDNSAKYPMRLFARQSVAAQVTPSDWFKYTRQGLVFFDDYFGIAYPFAKYDQVLVPQFIYGAMENAAAVTFSETAFLSSSAMTAEQREDLASVILHEMAHQWFGDLVTMRWWNGLWLNESFASYMAKLGSAGSTEFGDTWLSFYRSKQGAYRADDSISTHPIEVPVASTANAFDNIDSITYSKGASTLHQLRKLIGDETFRGGVHDYLTAHSYRNATLDDFIAALSKASGRDLKPWAQEWLYQPGANTLSADFHCSNGKIDRFRLQQSAAHASYPTLRSQLVQIGLFNLSGEQLTLSSQEPVLYSGASTEVPKLIGARCPELVYPNYQDWGFAKVILDPVSLTTARSGLARIQEPMLRSMLWQSLMDGLRDRRLGLRDFIDTVLDNVLGETDYTLVRQALGYVGTGKDYLRTFGGDSAYARSTTARMETVLWTGLQASRGDRDRASAWLGTYIDVASSDGALKNLREVLAGRVDAGGVAINQEIRWAIIAHLNRYGVPEGEALVVSELQRDKSERGQLSALASRVARPDAQNKAEWLGKIEQRPASEPFSRLRVMMRNLYPSGQEALAEATAGARLESLQRAEKAADPVFMRSYAGNLIPTSCSAASVARLERAMQKAASLSADTRRELLSQHEDDVRCASIRGQFEAKAGS